MSSYYKNVFTILLTIFILCNPKSSLAANWFKYGDNPVLKPSFIGWDSADINSPSVLYDGNQFKLWYQGKSADSEWSLGLAYSTDGVNWTKELLNPILSPSIDNLSSETGLEEPTVLKIDNTYHLWYKSNPTSTIRYAKSTDGIHWQKNPDSVLIGTEPWENAGVANPFVLYKNGKFMMWYTGWSSETPWLLGYAESTDGINWTKSLKNPLNIPIGSHMGAPHLIFSDGKFNMYYHTGEINPTVIYHAVSNNGIDDWLCPDVCKILTTTSEDWDSFRLVGPTQTDFNNVQYLYYGGNDGNSWQIGLATNSFLPIIKKPLIIIPGLFGSWNKEALLHNLNVDINDWEVNPIVTEYDGLIQTLTNLNYSQNQDFYIFKYDWRKGIDNIATDFNSWIQPIYNSHPNKQFNIVGHSLGGLVGRTYLQKYNSPRINKLITVGSPHQGVPQSYKLVEAGEIDNSNGLQWLATKLVLQLNRNGLKTDKQIVSEKFPIAKDLLPTFNFLKNSYGNYISIDDMSIKNDTLSFYTSGFPNYYKYLKTIAGEKNNTPSGYQITDRTLLDQLLDYYPDGRPETELKEIGDYTVLSRSAKAGYKSNILNLDHGELVYTTTGIKKIIDLLNIPYQNDQIVPSAKTKVFPSLIFLILSPASLQVQFNDQVYDEQQGMIFINNPQNGNYTIKAKGLANGLYSIIVGQLLSEKNIWSQIDGNINKSPPTNQTDSYTFNFDQNLPLDFPVNTLDPISLFKELNIYLTTLNKNLKRSDITSSINNLNQAQLFFQQKNQGRLKSTLFTIHQQLFSIYSKLDILNQNKIYYAIEKLENIYDKSLSGYLIGITPSRLSNKITNFRKSIEPTKNLFITYKDRGKDITYNTLNLIKTQDKLDMAEKYYNLGNYNLAEILLKTIEEMNKLIRIIR